MRTIARALLIFSIIIAAVFVNADRAACAKPAKKARNIYKILVLIVLAVSGAGKAIHLLAKRITGRYWLQLPLFILLFVLTYIVLRIPYDIGHTWMNTRAYHVPLMAGDIVAQLKTGLFSWLLISAAFTAAMFPLFGLIRRKPKSWWVVATLIATVLVFLEINIEQTVLSSMRDKSAPMADSPTKRKLEAILKEQGFKDVPIYIKPTLASPGMFEPGGQVIGIPPRIMLWNLEGIPDDRVEYLFAHELMHYKYKHTLIMLPMVFVIMGLGLPLCGALVRGIGKRYAAKTGFTQIHETQSFPAWMLGFVLLVFLSIPIQNGPWWFTENIADRAAARITGNPRSGAVYYARIIQYGELWPDPPKYLYVWQDPHPPIGSRVRMLKKLADEQRNKERNEAK